MMQRSDKNGRTFWECHSSFQSFSKVQLTARFMSQPNLYKKWRKIDWPSVCGQGIHLALIAFIQQGTNRRSVARQSRFEEPFLRAMRGPSRKEAMGGPPAARTLRRIDGSENKRYCTLNGHVMQEICLCICIYIYIHTVYYILSYQIIYNI